MPNKKFTGEVFYDELGRAMCSARVPGGDPEYCTDTNIYANSRCRLHGGKTPRNEQHWNFKGGKWSKYAKGSILNKLLDNYETGMEQLNLSEDIRLIDSFIADLLENDDGASSSALMLELKLSWDKYEDAVATGDVMGAERIKLNLSRLFERVGSEGEKRKAIREMQSDRIKAVQAQANIQSKIGDSLSFREITGIITQINNAVMGEVRDADTRRRILTKLRAIIAQSSSGSIPVSEFSDGPTEEGVQQPRRLNEGLG